MIIIARSIARLTGLALLCLASGLAGLAVTHGPAAAQTCLSPSEQRQAVASGHAIPLTHATRALRPEHRGEVVSARLCRAGEDLVYLLTVVDRRGKVTRIRLAAADGRLLSAR